MSLIFSVVHKPLSSKSVRWLQWAKKVILWGAMNLKNQTRFNVASQKLGWLRIWGLHLSIDYHVSNQYSATTDGF